MNMLEQVEKIYHSNLAKKEKIHQLKEIIHDCQHEMEAQDQNMQPKLKARISDAYQAANNYIMKLES